MKICVSLRGSAPPNLRSDNLRSEARWERQALEACLQNPEVSDVYTIGGWGGSHPKYRGEMNGSLVSETVLLMQDWNHSIATRHRFKCAIVNIFSGPWVEQIDEVNRAYNALGKNLLFTMGFPVMYRNEFAADSRWGSDPGKAESASHLLKFLPRENVHLLPVPGAPYIQQGSNFDSKNLIWCQRLVFMSQLEQSHTLLWSLQQLEKNPELTLDIFTGWYENEVKDYVNEQVVYRSNITEAFWDLPPFRALSSVRDRARIHLNLDWDTILGKYSQAKLLTTHGRLFGGPPIEASMHGVPFVGSGQTGALCDCPDYLYVGSEQEACLIFDKLLSDREYYNKISNSYRDYTSATYSFDAFNRNLNAILESRNLL